MKTINKLGYLIIVEDKEVTLERFNKKNVFLFFWSKCPPQAGTNYKGCNMSTNDDNVLKAITAVECARAHRLSDYTVEDEKRIDLLYYQRPTAALASGCREHYYLGFLAALDCLGKDEMLSLDDRIKLARSLTVEARKFLVDRDVIKPSSWMK